MNKNTAIMLISAFFCLIISFSAKSQSTRGIGGTVAGTETQSQKWAVIIGVGQYQDKGIGALPNAVNDARGLRDQLVGSVDGFDRKNVMLLASSEAAERQPTRANIIRYLGTYLKLAGPEDTVLVYFAGHGVTEGSKLYLLPSDATTALISESGYAYSLMEQQLEESKAKKKIVILDACHSGSGRGDDALTDAAAMEIEKSSEGMVTLASCSAKEKSHEMPQAGHGAFTYFLLKGLQGEADRDGNGVITASELSLYTWDETRRWAAEQGLFQTPWRLEKVAGDIVLGKIGRVQELVSNPTPARTAVADPLVTVPESPVLIKPSSAVPLPEGIKGLEMVTIQPGTFLMGSPPDEKDRHDDETQHSVTITRAYEIGKYEVTQGLWQWVMGSFKPEVHKGGVKFAFGLEATDRCLNCPVAYITWSEVEEFLVRLNEKLPGKAYRLPTEAEWEYACRAGTTSPHSGELKELSWATGNWIKEPQEVGQKRANAWGLHDMLGNVWEWCSDWYGPYPSGEAIDPLGPTNGRKHVARGGANDCGKEHLRSAARGSASIKFKRDTGAPGLSYWIGFRLARSLP